MANEMRTYYVTGQALYALVWDYSGSTPQVWYPTGAAFENKGTSGRTNNDYAIPLTDNSGFYAADFPSAIDPGDEYAFGIHVQLGANPADNDNPVGGSDMDWTGTAAAVTAVSEVGNTQICNWAVILAGGNWMKDRIDSYSTSTSKIAQACRDIYPMIRKVVFSRFQWNDLTEFADLGAALSGASLLAGADYTYQFNLPADCLWPVRLTSELDRTANYEFAIRQNILLCDEYTNEDGDSAYIEYVKNLGAAANWLPALHAALATRLAVDLARILDPERVTGLLAQYESVDLPVAMSANQQEVFVENEKGSFSILNARLG